LLVYYMFLLYEWSLCSREINTLLYFYFLHSTRSCLQIQWALKVYSVAAEK
jgi:hypothetical protein